MNTANIKIVTKKGTFVIRKKYYWYIKDDKIIRKVRYIMELMHQ